MYVFSNAKQYVKLTYLTVDEIFKNILKKVFGWKGVYFPVL